jgi:hypothetical protein
MLFLQTKATEPVLLREGRLFGAHPFEARGGAADRPELRIPSPIFFTHLVSANADRSAF